MATITLFRSVEFSGSANLGLMNVGYTLVPASGSPQARVGNVPSLSAFVPRYGQLVPQDASFQGQIVWDNGLTGTAYGEAEDDINPVTANPITLADKTGFALAANGLDAVVVEPSVSGGMALNLRQMVSLIGARVFGSWVRDPTSGAATFSAVANPTVARGVFTIGANSVSTSVSPPT